MALRPTKTIRYGAADTYVYDVKYGPDVIIATGSDHTIRSFRRDTLSVGPTTTFHRDTVTQLAFANNGNTLISSSKDSSIAIWDLRSGLTKPANVIRAGGIPILCVEVNKDETALVAGGELHSDDASVIVYDLRTNKLLAQMTESHSDDITSVKFHPSSSYRLMSTSTDGLVVTYDISASFDEDDAVLHVANTNSAIHTAGFFGHVGEFIYVLSTMETLGIWSAAECDLLHDYQDLRERTKADYFIDCIYKPGVSEGLILMGADNSGNIAIFDIQNDRSISPLQLLQSGHSEVVRSIDFDPVRNAMISGGEDGQISTWTL